MEYHCMESNQYILAKCACVIRGGQVEKHPLLPFLFNEHEKRNDIAFLFHSV